MSTRIGNKIVSGNNAVHKANVSLDNITSAGKEQIIVHVNENSTELTLPLATESTVGGVKVDGATISITEDGTISANVPEIDTSELALKSELDAKQDAGDYALRSELPDVSNLATKDEIPTVITSYNDLTDKPTIPSAYTLPTASTSTLGGVKVDGETIKINNGVISAESSGGSGEWEYGSSGQSWYMRNKTTGFMIQYIHWSGSVTLVKTTGKDALGGTTTYYAKSLAVSYLQPFQKHVITRDIYDVKKYTYTYSAYVYSDSPSIQLDYESISNFKLSFFRYDKAVTQTYEAYILAMGY